MKTICPHCKQEYPETPDEYLGMTLQCSVCEKEFVCEKFNTGLVPPQSPFVPPPAYNRHHRYSTTTDDSSKLPIKYLLGKLIKYTVIVVIVAGIGYAVWYNLPSNQKKRAETETELAHIRSTYMVNNGETDDFREEVKRLQRGYPKFGGNATQADYVRSVQEIVTNWNAAVRGFKNADKKMFSDVDSLLLLYALAGDGGAYRLSKDFGLPARLLLIQKSQAEAVEIGNKIYEAVEDDDIEEKERLLKEYNRLINLGNLQK